VECLHSAYSKFPPESGSVRIFKIGKNLTKLQPKFDSLLFLEHGVVVYRYSAEAGG